MDPDEQQKQQQQQQQPADGGQPYNPFRETPAGEPGDGQQPGSAAGEQQAEPGESGQQQQQQQAPSSDDRQTDIQRAVKAALAEVQQQQSGGQQQQQQQQPPPPQLTEEEFRKRTHYFEAKPEQLSTVFGMDFDEAQTKAFNDMMQSVAKQALTTSALYTRGQLGQVQQQVQPVLEQHQMATRQQQETMFYSKHKELEKYKDIVEAVGTAMQTEISSGRLQPYQSADDAIEALATRVKGVLKNAGLDIANTQGSAGQQAGQQSQAATQSGGQMAPLNGGGQKGAGGSSAPKNDAERIFGPGRR